MNFENLNSVYIRLCFALRCQYYFSLSLTWKPDNYCLTLIQHFFSENDHPVEKETLRGLDKLYEAGFKIDEKLTPMWPDTVKIKAGLSLFVLRKKF